MRWCELKVGDVLHNDEEPASYLVISVAKGNVYLSLDTGVIHDSGVPHPAAMMHECWRIE